MVKQMKEMCIRDRAYPFDGYWKDVGTIDSLWEANMDLLNPNVPLNLYDSEWKIYARNPGLPPHFVAKGADVQNSMITEGCEIWGTVDFSVLFSGVTVEKGAVVKDSIVMPGCVIKAGARVEYLSLIHIYGRLVYEIEFHVGRTEYDYEIDAASGTVLKADMDTDD